MQPQYCFAAVVVIAVTAANLRAADPPKLPYTISKETTAITSPLKPDGSPDYVAALREIYGKGVTTDNNGFAAFLTVVGTESNMFHDRVHDETLDLLGMQATPAGTAVYQSFADYLQSDTFATFPDEMETRFQELRRKPWKPDQFPLAAKYLEKQGPFLDRIVAASKKPRWWCPLISPHGSMLEIVLPSMGRVRNASTALGARANLRANAADFDGALSDILAMKRLAHLVGQGHTVIEQLQAVAMNNLADDTISTIAGSGALTEAQCARLLEALMERETWPGIARAIDLFERWAELDCVVRVATGDTTYLRRNAIGVPADAPPIAIDHTEVDWDYVLQRMNQELDTLVATMKLEPMKDFLAKSGEFDQKVRKWDAQLEEQWRADIGTLITSAALKKHPNETRGAYSERIAQLMMALYSPNLGMAEELRRRSLLTDDLTRVLLAAAIYKARMRPGGGIGNWPDKLELLTPSLLPSVPRDLYADTASPRYLITPAGIRIYSVGPNGIDDGGRRGVNNADDIGVGVSVDVVVPKLP